MSIRLGQPSLWLWLAAAVPLAWLVPNHDPPWLSAWSEGAALVLAALAAAFAGRAGGVPRPWLLALALAAGSVLWQWARGRIYFGGDAVVVALYLAALLVAIATGGTLVERRSAGRAGPDGVQAVALGTLAAGILSVATAMVQWLGVGDIVLWVVAVKPGAVPTGNVSQANHLSTITFLALTSLALLRQSGRIGGLGFWVAAAWLLVGMTASGSRTGWLQMGLWLVFAWLARRRLDLQPGWRSAASMGALLAALTLAWPWLNAMLDLQAVRPAGALTSGNKRPLAWLEFADAVLREPWSGYGWNQVAAAQWRVAADHDPLKAHFEHAHNVVLDLLLWTGVPVGLAITLPLAWWFVSRARALRDGQSFWLLLGVAGLLVHGLLEYPLEYAYFLLPAGFAIGAVEARHRPVHAWAVPRTLLRAAGAVVCVAVAAVAYDYLRAEQAFRLLRFEAMGIGARGPTTPPPHLPLLTQLEGFQRFVHTQAREGMSEAELEHFRRVAERFPYPPVLLRHALAQGLNGDHAGAGLTLRRLCHMHPAARCDEGRASWRALQERFPQLQAVAAP